MTAGTLHEKLWFHTLSIRVCLVRGPAGNHFFDSILDPAFVISTSHDAYRGSSSAADFTASSTVDEGRGFELIVEIAGGVMEAIKIWSMIAAAALL